MRLYLIFMLVISASFLYGQDTGKYESPKVLTLKDSIFTISDQYDMVFYEHELKERQTLYSVSHYFGLDLFRLYEFNPRLRTDVAKVGDIIRLPFPVHGIRNGRSKTATSIPVFYRVKPKDNIFRISRVMFDKEQAIIKNMNNINQNDLQIGDTLFIGWWNLEGIESDTSDYSRTSLEKSFDSLKEKYEYDSAEYKYRNHQGMATWTQGKQMQSGFYVIHTSAKPGSVIKITNPMVNRVAYAKVVANLPPNTYEKSVLAVLSPSLANYLGIIDRRIFLKMSYLQQN